MDQELQQLQKWVEKFPCACPRWLWGSRVSLMVYDPDYMKVVLARSGETETCIAAGAALSAWVHDLELIIPE